MVEGCDSWAAKEDSKFREGGVHAVWRWWVLEISKDQTKVVQHSMRHKDKYEAVESFHDNSDTVEQCGKGRKTCEFEAKDFVNIL